MKPKQPLVEWQGGVHIVGTPIWCDATRAREACFVSSAAVRLSKKHRQLIATEATLRLLPDTLVERQLAVPYGRPFTLGDVRLELFPSGAMPGSASLLAYVGKTRVVYAGAVSREAEVRSCDALVLDATFGHPRYRFPPRADVQAELMAWTRACLTDGMTPVVLCDPLRTAPMLARQLGAVGEVRVHRTIAAVAKALGDRLSQAKARPSAGQIVLWPMQHSDDRAMWGLDRCRVALVSGFAMDVAVVRRLRADAAFPWAELAGFDGLLRYVEQSGATEVHCLGEADDLVRKIGRRARVFGAPKQLLLF